MCVVPDGDLFKAIRDGQASVVTDHIDTFTENGIRLQLGRGARGRHRRHRDRARAAVPRRHRAVRRRRTRRRRRARLTYKGMMLEGVPNLAFAVGLHERLAGRCKVRPHLPSTSTRLLNRLRDTGLRQCTPVNDDPDVEPEPLSASVGLHQAGPGPVPQAGTPAPLAGAPELPRRTTGPTRRADVDDGADAVSNPGTPGWSSSPGRVPATVPRPRARLCAVDCRVRPVIRRSVLTAGGNGPDHGDRQAAGAPGRGPSLPRSTGHSRGR